jgi:ribosomal protein L44E
MNPGFIPDGLENGMTEDQRMAEQQRRFTRTAIADPGVSPIPSMYQEKRQRHRDNPDLVLRCQLQDYLIIGLLKQLRVKAFELSAADVIEIRGERAEVEETERGGIKATRQS